MKTLSDYMKINYRMKIVEDAEEGGFVVSFPELPGCFTCGDTKEKAIANAIDAKRAWFEAALEAGMEINITWHDHNCTLAKKGVPHGTNIYERKENITACIVDVAANDVVHACKFFIQHC